MKITRTVLFILVILILSSIFSTNIFALPEIDFNVETTENANLNVYETESNTSDSAELMAVIVFSGGSGTADDPYLLSNSNDLKKLAGYVSIGGKKYISAYYKLINDIDLEGEEWTPIGNYISDDTGYTTCFQGVFDGNGKTVSNFTITEETYYTGFFGYVYNGSVRNLTISDFSIELDSDTYVYTGSLIGRFLSIGQNINSYISNCHAINGTIKAKSSTRVYGGGLIGYLHASMGAAQYVENSSADIDCNFTVDNKVIGTSTRYYLSAGGFVGYAAAVDNGTLEIIRSYSTGTVSAQLSDTNKYYRNSPHVGGLIGDVGAQNSGVIDLNECYSTSGVFVKSDGETYAASLLGYTIANEGEISLSNCHTNANVYAYSSSNDTYISGFSAILATQGATSLLNIENNYTISNVVYTGIGYSDGGRFTAYFTGNVNATNCYYADNSALYVTNNEITLGTGIGSSDMTNLVSYQGFMNDIWETDDSLFYPYPVLKNNKITNVKYTMYFANAKCEYFDKTLTDSFGKTVEFPEETPVNTAYNFSHWSVYPDAPDATDYRITSDTLFFPNFSDIRSYTIYFSANGTVFDSDFLEYGSAVVFPEAPEKPADSVFSYKFDYWSNTENGIAIDTSCQTVTGETTYYAVYKIIPLHVWDGVTAKAFRGSGTITDPYIIKNSYQLYQLSNLVNSGNTEYADACYLLCSDIDLGGFEWTPIGTESTPFTGNFNGDGYSIHSFKITSPTTEYAGVFGYAQNAQIIKLHVYDFDISITFTDPDKSVYVGAVAGYVTSNNNIESTLISECMSEGKINISAQNVYAGGIIGYAEKNSSGILQIQNCSSSATLESFAEESSYAGGICGAFYSNDTEGGLIDSCGVSGSIRSESNNCAYSGGISAFIFHSGPENKYVIKNCFVASDKISAIGEDISYAGYMFADKNSNANVLNCYASRNISLSGSQNSNINNDIIITTPSNFNSKKYLKNNIKLDIDNIWYSNSNSLPVLATFNQVKNYFEIKSFGYQNDGKIFKTILDIRYRTQEKYTVLAAAYDSRGKMISFAAKTINNPDELQSITLTLTGIDNAENCTVSVINPVNLQFLEDTMKISK